METPLILFVGMPDSGKTMATYSLAEYLETLEGKHYKVEPDYSFLPGDANYRKKCDDFRNKLNLNRSLMNSETSQRYAMAKTNSDTFLKINVTEGRESVCDILEVSGELFFQPDNIKEGISGKITELINPNALSRGKIYFVLLLDLYTKNWINPKVREQDAKIFQAFVDMMKSIVANYKDGDKVIALMNRCDESKNFQKDWQRWEVAFGDFFRALSEEKKYIFFDKIKVAKLPYSCGHGFEDNYDPNTKELVKDKEKIYNTDKTTRSYAAALWAEITKKFTWL